MTQGTFWLYDINSGTNLPFFVNRKTQGNKTKRLSIIFYPKSNKPIQSSSPSVPSSVPFSSIFSKAERALLVLTLPNISFTLVAVLKNNSDQKNNMTKVLSTNQFQEKI